MVPRLIPTPDELDAIPSGTPSLATPPFAPLSKPPAKTILPPPDKPLVVSPLAVLMVLLFPSVIFPPFELSESAQKIKSPVLVVKL